MRGPVRSMAMVGWMLAASGLAEAQTRFEPGVWRVAGTVKSVNERIVRLDLDASTTAAVQARPQQFTLNPETAIVDPRWPEQSTALQAGDRVAVFYREPQGEPVTERIEVIGPLNARTSRR